MVCTSMAQLYWVQIALSSQESLPKQESHAATPTIDELRQSRSPPPRMSVPDPPLGSKEG